MTPALSPSSPVASAGTASHGRAAGARPTGTAGPRTARRQIDAPGLAAAVWLCDPRATS
jgi:hypothetical protein